MALVVAGTVAAMAPGAEDEVAAGRVWLADGQVVAVTRDGDASPPGFDDAPVVDVGDAIVAPGFVDLHSHLGYNTLPLWAEPTQTGAYAHHDSWPDEASYRPQVGWPAWTLARFAPEVLLAYVQVRALAGGTTAIQGWPVGNRKPVNRLVRCVDNDEVGSLRDPVRVSSLTKEPADLEDSAEDLRDGRTFIYHCAEGRPGTRVTEEFDDVARAGCLQQGLVVVHGTALGAPAFRRWRDDADPPQGEPAGTVVWSPFSNLWLYGVTTAVPEVLDAGLTVSLGTDWGPSGTKNLLGEVKVARLASDAAGWDLSDHQLVRMLTTAPGDALARAWRQPVGRLVPGAVADVTVLARRHADPWRSVVTAREADVALVVVGGRAHYGTAAALRASGERATTPVRIGRATRRVRLVRPDDPDETWSWADVLARLEAVRTEAAATPPAGPAGSRTPGSGTPGRARPEIAGDPPGTPPLAIELDMPGGPGTLAGPPPPDTTVDIPPIQTVHHDARWLASIRGRGFHGGVLDGLRAQF